MNISELSIRRPVLATVLTIIIILFGMIGYQFVTCVDAINSYEGVFGRIHTDCLSKFFRITNHIQHIIPNLECKP